MTVFAWNIPGLSVTNEIVLSDIATSVQLKVTPLSFSTTVFAEKSMT